MTKVLGDARLASRNGEHCRSEDFGVDRQFEVQMKQMEQQKRDGCR